MAKKAASVQEYIDGLSPDRREAIQQVRKVILENLPKGYEEALTYGVLCYEVPLARLPDTYNGRPLCYVALGSQKNYMSLYLMNIYGDAKAAKWFKSTRCDWRGDCPHADGRMDSHLSRLTKS